MLVVRALDKVFPSADSPALRSIELRVEEGEILALLGESGSGKTTLLRCVAGLEEPSQGSVQLDGVFVNREGLSLPPEKRGVRMVFQETTLFPHLTVARNLLFGAPRGGRNATDRVAKALQLVRLSGLQDRYPHQLSGGQRQRAELARALVSEPKLLLLDEPFSSLDTRLRDALRTEMRHILSTTGTTTIMVSHDVDDAFAIADRVAILRAGRICQIGSCADLYDRPVDEYVASLVGPANFLSGTSVADGYSTPLGLLRCPVAGPPDRPVQLCIRPSGFQIDSEALDSIPARVVDVVLGRGGDHLRVSAAPSDGDSDGVQLLVKRPSRNDVSTGDTVALTAVPERIWCFPDSRDQRPAD